MLRPARLVPILLVLAPACQQGAAPPPPEGRAAPAATRAPAAPPPPEGRDVPAPRPTDPPPARPTRPPPLPLDAPPDGATRTASGLAFASLADGAGARPGRNDAVSIRYTVWRADGTTLATTAPGDTPTTMLLHQAAPGFAEAMTMMKVGGEAMFWVPPEIGYPRRPPPDPEPLIYAVELVGVAAAPRTPPDLARPPAHARRDASGVRWTKVTPARTQAERPRPWDAVELVYTGWDASGTIVDTNELGGQPIKLAVEALPAVLAGAVPALAAGERARVWFPAEQLGPAPDGGPEGLLTFEVGVVAIERLPEPPPPPPDVAAPPDDARRTPRGVAYVALHAGDGARPAATDEVLVRYTGWTTDGKRFDGTHGDDAPRPLRVNGVIPGWTDALLQMRVGDRWRIWIPEELAYKGAPRRPQGMLVFDVELVAIAAATAPGGP